MAGRCNHTPIRTCVICRQKTDKRGLTRLVRTPDGIAIDPTGKMQGRGSYLCQQRDCWAQAFTGNRLSDVLRMTLTDQDRERIRLAMPD